MYDALSREAIINSSTDAEEIYPVKPSFNRSKYKRHNRALFAARQPSNISTASDGLMSEKPLSRSIDTLVDNIRHGRCVEDPEMRLRLEKKLEEYRRNRAVPRPGYNWCIESYGECDGENICTLTFQDRGGLTFYGTPEEVIATLSPTVDWETFVRLIHESNERKVPFRLPPPQPPMKKFDNRLLPSPVSSA